MRFAAFESVQEAGAALADEVASALRQGLDARGMAGLAVPGGRTPVPFFHALRVQPLDWSHIHVTLTDERWVDETDAASNARLVRTGLLQQQAQGARFMPLYHGGATVEADAAVASERLAGLPRPFDAIVLGMGEDGHVASLFPGSAGLARALDPAAGPACVAMQAPSPPVQRLSLNLAALRATRRMFLFVTGTVKRELLFAAVEASDPLHWPVAALMPQAPELEVFWAP